MPDEPTLTPTQVKIKTVSTAKIAIALAFLGVSALAAAAALTPMAPDGKGAPVCTDIDIATVNAAGMPLAIYQYVNLGQKGIATGLGSNGVQMMGEDKCWNNTRILEYFCNVKKNIVSWNSYNCPTGTNCKDGACGAKSITINGDTAVECCNVCKTWDVTCPPNQLMTEAECGAVGGQYLGLIAYSKCLSQINAPTPKTCNDALKDPNAYAMFAFCKDKGYKSVCFDKYTLVYQVCSDEVGTGCLTGIANAANNIRCLVGCASSSTPPGVYSAECDSL